MVGGLQWAFGLGAVISLAVVVLALMLPRRTPATDDTAATEHPESTGHADVPAPTH